MERTRKFEKFRVFKSSWRAGASFSRIQNPCNLCIVEDDERGRKIYATEWIRRFVEKVFENP